MQKTVLIFLVIGNTRFRCFIYSPLKKEVSSYKISCAFLSIYPFPFSTCTIHKVWIFLLFLYKFLAFIVVSSLSLAAKVEVFIVATWIMTKIYSNIFFMRNYYSLLWCEFLPDISYHKTISFMKHKFHVVKIVMMHL